MLLSGLKNKTENNRFYISVYGTYYFIIYCTVMKLLKDRILKDGKSFDGGILKVDSFINHQMDPILMKSIGVEFVRRFGNLPINKVVTIEASGIAPAYYVRIFIGITCGFCEESEA